MAETLFGKPKDEVIKKPGALRAELHAKPGKNIPEAKLKKAEHSSNPKIAKRARLAETMRGWHK